MSWLHRYACTDTAQPQREHSQEQHQRNAQSNMQLTHPSPSMPRLRRSEYAQAPMQSATGYDSTVLRSGLYGTNQSANSVTLKGPPEPASRVAFKEPQQRGFPLPGSLGPIPVTGTFGARDDDDLLSREREAIVLRALSRNPNESLVGGYHSPGKISVRSSLCDHRCAIIVL